MRRIQKKTLRFAPNFRTKDDSTRVWCNGSHERLKISWIHVRGGSSPSTRTKCFPSFFFGQSSLFFFTACLAFVLLRRGFLPSFLILVPAELEKGKEAFGPSSLLACAGGGFGDWFALVFGRLSFSAFGRKLLFFFCGEFFRNINLDYLFFLLYQEACRKFLFTLLKRLFHFVRLGTWSRRHVGWGFRSLRFLSS